MLHWGFFRRCDLQFCSWALELLIEIHKKAPEGQKIREAGPPYCQGDRDGV
jgi:hypothetical protein